MKKSVKKSRPEACLPKTAYQFRKSKVIDSCLEYFQDYEQLKPYMPYIHSHVLDPENQRDVVLIQISIGVTGGNYGVFVPVSIVDPYADDVVNYAGDKFSLMDLSALFNAYFWDQGADPGFKVNAIRDNLINKNLIEWIAHSNAFQITARGRQFVEKQLEFHATVDRPVYVLEMFYPHRNNVTEFRERRSFTELQRKIVPYKDCTDPIYDEIVRQVRESHL